MWTKEEFKKFSSTVNFMLDPSLRCGSDKLHQPHWHDEKWCDGKAGKDVRVW